MTFPTFTNGQVLPASDLNAIGLWLVKTQTVGAGVSSVTVTGAFSADYDNYRIVFANGIQASNDLALQIQFAATTGHYANMRYEQWAGATGTLPTANQNFAYFGLSGTQNQQSMSLDVYGPNLAQYTKYSGTFTSANYYGTGGGVYAQTTQLTGFTLIAPGNTFTGGTIKVYGYRN